MSRRGFTLLETLVALAVTALVLTTLAGTVRRAIAAREQATAEAERLAGTRALLLRVARELEATVSAETIADRLVAEPPAPWSTLRFTTLAGDPADARALTYRVAPGGVLVRESRSRFAPADGPDPAPVPVLERVREFRVRCFDGAAWSSGWDMPRLPHAVELTLGVDDGRGGVDELATTVALPLRRSG